MERFCGHLKHGGAASKRFPYKSLDNYLFDWTVLWHLGAIHNLRDALRLRPSPKLKTFQDGGSTLDIPGREFEILLHIGPLLMYIIAQLMEVFLWDDSSCPKQLTPKFSCMWWEMSCRISPRLSQIPPWHGGFLMP